MQSFTEKVYAIARQIPRGKVMTYGQLAKIVGSPRASRAVGVCMKRNPDLNDVPCYRVVASDGKLTGYAGEGGVNSKKAKLLKDGVHFIGDRVDLSKSLWEPK